MILLEKFIELLSITREYALFVKYTKDHRGGQGAARKRNAQNWEIIDQHTGVGGRLGG